MLQYEPLFRSLYALQKDTEETLCHIHKEVIAFVEVKTRKENSLTQPIDAVNRKKQMRISKTADAYMYENNIEKPCRFDVCEVFVNSDNLKLVGINYIEDAF